jgi:hypothetical protein
LSGGEDGFEDNNADENKAEISGEGDIADNGRRSPTNNIPQQYGKTSDLHNMEDNNTEDNETLTALARMKRATKK